MAKHKREDPKGGNAHDRAKARIVILEKESLPTSTPAHFEPREESAIDRIIAFTEHPHFLFACGIILSAVGSFFYTPAIVITVACVVAAFHRTKVAKGLSRKLQVLAYLVIVVMAGAISWGGVYLAKKKTRMAESDLLAEIKQPDPPLAANPLPPVDPDPYVVPNPDPKQILVENYGQITGGQINGNTQISGTDAPRKQVAIHVGRGVHGRIPDITGVTFCTGDDWRCFLTEAKTYAKRGNTKKFEHAVQTFRPVVDLRGNVMVMRGNKKAKQQCDQKFKDAVALLRAHTDDESATIPTLLYNPPVCLRQQ